MPFACAHNTARIGPRQLATVKHRFKDVARVWRQASEPDLFFHPEKNPCSETVWLNQALHKCHLIDTDGQEEPYKFSESLFTEFTAPVEAIAARTIAIGEMSLVGFDVACHSPCHGPHPTSIQCFEQHGVRYKPSYAAVSIEKRVKPQKPMMRGRST